MNILKKSLITSVFLIITIQSFVVSANQNQQDLLMKGLYEYEKKADYTNDPEGKRKSQEFIKQYENMQKQKRLMEEKREEVEIRKEALRISEEQKKSTPQKDMTPVVEDAVMKKYGVSRIEANKMIQNNDHRVEQIWQSMVKVETEKVLKEARKRVLARKKNNIQK